LDSIITCAPRAWWPTLERLADLGLRHSADARVVGSLAWQALTGLTYLTPQSDLDFVLHTRPDTDLPRLAASIQTIETAAPMRLDGELIRTDDAAVSWREFNAGACQLLVKTAAGVALIDRNDFVSGSATP
jgi:phosphoribosyl-dephospho-CoA transferase